MSVPDVSWHCLKWLTFCVFFFFFTIRYSAFDNEKCTEVNWIEYRDVPRSVFDKFQENLERLLKLDHPNLVKYYAGWADRKNRSFIFISEQVTGDLRNLLLKKVEMASKVYVRWIGQLARALDYLHKQNWVHHDLRTNNIFIRGTGELKIGGLAESFFSEVHFADKTFQVGLGAPELAFGIKPGPQQDVYQLGLVALQTFSFHHPFRGFQLPQQICKAQLENIKPPELSIVKEKDPIAYDLISRCLDPLDKRITLTDILKHPYLQEEGGSASSLKQAELLKSPESPKLSELPSDAKMMSGSLPSRVQQEAPGAPTSSGGAKGIVKTQQIATEVVAVQKTMKCYIGNRSTDAPCVRLRFDGLTSVADLRSMIEADFSEQLLFPKDLSLKYRDADGDLVIITNRTTLKDIVEFAVCLELHPNKLTVGVKASDSLLGDLLK